jgi:4-oxalocrotonate tautomerase
MLRISTRHVSREFQFQIKINAFFIWNWNYTTKPWSIKMPYVNIRVTGGSDAPTKEQKAELIRGATELLVRVLGKKPATTVVVIDEVELDNWGIGGESVTERRKKT